MRPGGETSHSEGCDIVYKRGQIGITRDCARGSKGNSMVTGDRDTERNL